MHDARYRMQEAGLKEAWMLGGLEGDGVFTLMTSEILIRTHRVSSTSKTGDMSEQAGLFAGLTSDLRKLEDLFFYFYVIPVTDHMQAY